MKVFSIICIFIILLSVFSGCINLESDDDKSESKEIDSDDDEVTDEKDAFLYDPSASIDTDEDGYPDEWNPGKTQEDSNSGLTLDSFPYDPSASIDTDNDGYPDVWNLGKTQKNSTSVPPLELDEYPTDPKTHKDTDKDGIADFYDINDLVDLKLEIKLEKFKVTKRVDLLRWAQVSFEIQVENNVKKIDDNGRKYWVLLNEEKSVNHVVTYDIPDNTTDDFTNIKIRMYEYDLFKDPVLLDINPDSTYTDVSLNFDNVENKISFDSISEGSQATIWFSIDYQEESIPKTDDDYLSRTYKWMYLEEDYEMTAEIPIELYNYYLGYPINRAPQDDELSFVSMRKYVTSNDESIIDISNDLEKIAEKQGFDEVQTANFILKFVQYNVEYTLDNKTKGYIEYWRFPVETLVDKKGDCEDTSLLYATIMDALGYDVVLLFYTWEENGELVGHLSVGLNVNTISDGYIKDKYGDKYYYCETTNKNFYLGEIPDDPVKIKEMSPEIIHIL